MIELILAMAISVGYIMILVKLGIWAGKQILKETK